MPRLTPKPLRRRQRSTSQLDEDMDGVYAVTVTALAAALELRDDETGGHARRVTELALAVAQSVAPDLAADPRLRYGFLLHDIGKIGIPDSILHKPGPLDDAERSQMEYHTTLGEHLLRSIPHLHGIATDVVAYHHERWDGAGYPWGLAGEAIPLPARIFAVADAFDAMTNDRPHRQAMSVGDAIEEVVREAGRQFDPVVVDHFRAIAAGFDRPLAA